MHSIARSRLPALLLQLGLVSRSLPIVAPHKRPELTPE
jgi:hypothetical protein